MIKILGVDLGNYGAKTSEGVLIPSRVALGHKDLNKDAIKVIYNNKKYTVGTGNLKLGTSRIHSTLYDLCLLTSISKSYPNEKNISVNIVMGLPPLQYESVLKKELEKKLSEFKTKKIIIDGDEITITINKSAVFSESAIVFGNPSKYRDKKTLVLDFGGGSTDISQFKGLELVKNTTTKLGMLTLCENMKQALDAKETVTSTIDDMEELINADNAVIHGDNKDITYLKDVVTDHMVSIFNVVNQSFDTESTDIIAIGGGANKLESNIKGEYKNAVIAKDSQFVNANVYGMVGEMLWSGKN